MKHEIEIDRPIEDLAGLLGHSAEGWLGRFASISSNAAETAARREHGGPAADPCRSVSLWVGDFGSDDDSTLDRLSVPLRWETFGYRWFFRAFEGRLTLFGLADGGCLVRLEGTYVGRAGSLEPAERVAAEAGFATLLRLMREAAEEQARTQA